MKALRDRSWRLQRLSTRERRSAANGGSRRRKACRASGCAPQFRPAQPMKREFDCVPIVCPNDWDLTEKLAYRGSNLSMPAPVQACQLANQSHSPKSMITAVVGGEIRAFLMFHKK